jgi:hypothetical protein
LWKKYVDNIESKDNSFRSKECRWQYVICVQWQKIYGIALKAGFQQNIDILRPSTALEIIVFWQCPTADVLINCPEKLAYVYFA